ncbi:MAG TPA: Veg protein [Firmicutes bacterium]|nr:Veg protein [Bacillota bacterium]
MERTTLAEIRQDLEANRGRRLRLTANRGRQRIIVREGVLEQTYPNVFTIKLLDSNSVKRVSFSYSDVLTKTVEISLCDQDERKIACN